ncbi:MAG: LLM class flavin-dependent oxidoreductase, partial [Ilumatobacter sp.]
MDTRRPGMTVPLPGPLHAQRERLVELADLGYTDIWSAESDGADGFTPLTLAAAWEPRLRLGTAIVPAFTRAPACMALSAASLAVAAPGRFLLGLGSSSNVIV